MGQFFLKNPPLIYKEADGSDIVIKDKLTYIARIGSIYIIYTYKQVMDIQYVDILTGENLSSI